MTSSLIADLQTLELTIKIDSSTQLIGSINNKTGISLLLSTPKSQVHS
jgi:hypothetical protein